MRFCQAIPAVCATVIMGMAAAQSISSPPASSPSVPQGKRQTLPLYLSEHRMLVMLRVGGSYPFPAVFDTGTNGNLIDAGLADALKLPNTGSSPSIDGSTGKPVAGHDTFIRGATISGVAIEDARATAFSYNEPDEVAIIGPNSFPGKLVRLEGARSRLVLLPNIPEFLPGCTPFHYLGDKGAALPSAVVEVGGFKVTAILDSGNDAALILPMEWAKTLPLESAPKQIGFAVSAAGKQPILSAQLNGVLTIGSVSLSHPEIRFMEGGRPNVGLPLLRTLTLVMDPSGQKDWVLPSEAKGTSCTATPPGSTGK